MRKLATPLAAQPPHVVHVVLRLDVGGLENGLVNLINNMPEDSFRHSIVCLTRCTAFRKRISRFGVAVYELNKQAGKDPGMYFRLGRLLRELAPDIVHTRNMATLEAQVPAWLAGVKGRVHGEHGRDMPDLYGRNAKYRWMRRLHRPLIGHYIALSRDLEAYLRDAIGVAQDDVTQIYNGVDSKRFSPASAGRDALPHPGFASPDSFVIGNVGRMMSVKDPLTLAKAFVHLASTHPELRPRLRLVMVGDGPLKAPVSELLQNAGVLQQAWLAGERDDVAALMRGFDLFVLPSLAEGISNTLLEAMASGLAVVATEVGGNSELLENGRCGSLVAPDDPIAMAQAILGYITQPQRRIGHALQGRSRAEARFGMDAMVRSYSAVYSRVLASAASRAPVRI